MEYINSYVRARKFFLEEFVPERKRVIKHLKNLKDEIQHQTEIQNIGSIAYSGGSILSGGALLFSVLAAPMTAGVSTAVTFGLYGSFIFGGADITHRLIKGGLTSKLLEDAQTSFEAHKITFSNLKGDFLLKLIEDIETIQSKIEVIREIKCDEKQEIEKFLDHLKEIGLLIEVPPDSEKFLNIMMKKCSLIFESLLSNGLFSRGVSTVAKVVAVSGAKEVAEEVIKESATNLAKKGVYNGSKQFAKKGIKLGTKGFAKGGAKNCVRQIAKEGVRDSAHLVKGFKVASVGFGLGLDLLSLVYSVNDLSRFSDGELCAEAEKMNSIIKQMETELKYLEHWFEERADEEFYYGGDGD